MSLELIVFIILGLLFFGEMQIMVEQEKTSARLKRLEERSGIR